MASTAVAVSREVRAFRGFWPRKKDSKHSQQDEERARTDKVRQKPSVA
jgi:hypothetical protein